LKKSTHIGEILIPMIRGRGSLLFATQVIILHLSISIKLSLFYLSFL